MPRAFEIMFHDLNTDAQQEYLAFAEAQSPADINADVAPIAIVENENDESNYDD